MAGGEEISPTRVVLGACLPPQVRPPCGWMAALGTELAAVPQPRGTVAFRPPVNVTVDVVFWPWCGTGLGRYRARSDRRQGANAC